VYDMYPWDSDSQGDYPPEPLRSWRDPNPPDTSRETAAGTRAAGTRATPPTTSVTRQ